MLLSIRGREGEGTPPFHFMNKKMLVGLDVAEKMGVVYSVYGSGRYFTTVYRGSPVEQLQMLEDVLGEDVKGACIFYEELNTFVNANTTRSLLHRVGYLKNSLLKLGAERVEPVNAISARKFLGLPTKTEVGDFFKPWGLTQDEADAMAVLLFAKAEPKELLTEESITCLR